MSGSERKVNLKIDRRNDSVFSFKIGLLPSGKVKLCRSTAYSYGTYDTTVGDFGAMPKDIRNYKISRIQIPKVFSFQYYECLNLGGKTRKFDSYDQSYDLNIGDYSDAVRSF